MITLSIVIPAYNEAAFIGTLLERIAAVDLTDLGVTREIIVVDDGSHDATADIAERHGVRVLRQRPNAGKGAAVRRGIAAAAGTHVLIQDADLEYDPRDYLPMLAALRHGGDTIAVYGSRYLNAATGSGGAPRMRVGPWPGQSWPAFLGGRSLSVAAWLTTGRFLTDTVTALKLFPRDLVSGLALETSGFQLDHEISAKVLARGVRIVEVPIGYQPRSKAEGKKIGAADWWCALRTFWRYRHG